MARRPKPLGRRVAEVAHRRLRRGRLDVHDLGSESRGAVLRVGVGSGSAHAVVDVDGRDVVAERAERVPETGGVGATRDEARDAPARLDELVGADERLDARGQVGHHASSVTEGAVVPSCVRLQRRRIGDLIGRRQLELERLAVVVDLEDDEP